MSWRPPRTARSPSRRLRATAYDVVLLDLKLSQESGLDVLEEILRHLAPDRGRHGDGLRLRARRRWKRCGAARSTICRSLARPIKCGRFWRASRRRRSWSAGSPNWSRGSKPRARRATSRRNRRPCKRRSRSPFKRRGERGHHPAARRERHGQERARARHASAQPAARRRFRHRELSQPLAGIAGERSLRACEGRLHRRAC